MDWIARALETSKMKKGREGLHYAITDWYQQLQDAGYDHEEAREVIRGVVALRSPQCVPVVMLWIERAGRKE